MINFIKIYKTPTFIITGIVINSLDDALLVVQNELTYIVKHEQELIDLKEEDIKSVRRKIRKCKTYLIKYQGYYLDELGVKNTIMHKKLDKFIC